MKAFTVYAGASPRSTRPGQPEGEATRRPRRSSRRRASYRPSSVTTRAPRTNRTPPLTLVPARTLLVLCVASDPVFANHTQVLHPALCCHPSVRYAPSTHTDLSRPCERERDPRGLVNALGVVLRLGVSLR
jgi:hypothetical protein